MVGFGWGMVGEGKEERRKEQNKRKMQVWKRQSCSSVVAGFFAHAWDGLKSPYAFPHKMGILVCK